MGNDEHWPSRPDLDHIPTYRTSNDGARGVREEMGARPDAAQIPFNAPDRGSFASMDRKGAYLFLSTGQLLALRDLFQGLNAIDKILGPADTERPAWRAYIELEIDRVLRDLSDTT